METTNETKPPRELVALVNRTAHGLTQLHGPGIRARLLLAAVSAMQRREDWRAAIEAQAAAETAGISAIKTSAGIPAVTAGGRHE